ncbi:MAG: oligosaccharide flippase family protein [Bacilli bacterium]|nr:oligosaccharide flippase family protein [Bacilli bacterium]
MKNKFFRSTLILMIGALLTKLLGFIIRIIFTRTVSEADINLHSLIMPTYSLLITLAQLGLPLAISNIIAENKTSSKKVLFSIIPASLIINIILIAIVFITAPYISTNLLHNSNAYYPIISIAFILPFISLSSIIRGYFFGKQKMLPHTISNIIEQIFRLLIIVIFLPKLLKYGTILTVSVYILFNIISEIISIIVFLMFLPKNFTINKKDLKPDITVVKDVLSIAIPTTSSRIIGNIGYFFEPIILTFTLSLIGYSSDYILGEYGTYNAYVLALLTIPSFFILALDTSLIPEISKNKNNKNIIKRRLKQSITMSLIVGLICNTFVYIFTEDLLNIIFNTNRGIDYIRFLCPFFILLYLEGPLASTLQALNYAKYTMKVTIITTIIKLITLFLFSLLHIGLYGLLLSEVFNILLIIYLNSKKIVKVLN